MNPIEIKRIDADCFKIIVDGEPLGNNLNAGYFTYHDIQTIGDACQIATIDNELSSVTLGHSHEGEHGADDHRRQIEQDCEG